MFFVYILIDTFTYALLYKMSFFFVKYWLVLHCMKISAAATRAIVSCNSKL